MEINTRFDLNQEVFFMEENKVASGRIANLTASAYTGKVLCINYVVSKVKGASRTIEEHLLFDTKENLIKAL